MIALPSVEEAKVIAKLVVIVVILAAAASGGWYVKGRFDEGTIERLKSERDAALTQGKILGSSLEACNAGVASTKSTADKALKLAQDTLAALGPIVARQRQAVGKLEDLLKAPPPAGAGCREAWKALEQLRKAGAQ